MENQYKYTPQDFKTDNEIKWCPGCGDHIILGAVVKAMPEIAEAQGFKHEDFAFISGIGCSSRFPYYMKTYGFHTIHGRAAAIASGVKVANPKLSVWIVTGDGDSLAIGGNHFIHAVRRNIDMNILLFNNEIYGLTKGQYSPTSKLGKKTKTSPMGTIEQPFNPGELAIGARGTFFARSLDMEMEMTKNILIEAAAHKGTSVVEILQNCVIFNDETFAEFAGNKEKRATNLLLLKHGEKMLFGKEKEKGIVQQGMSLRVVTIGEDGATLDQVLTHNAQEPNSGLHTLLANMKFPEFPVAVGVIRSVKGETYDDRMGKQLEEAKQVSKIKCMDDLLNSGDTWTI